MDSILNVSNLSVVLDHKVIFENISFELKARQTLVILGPNGAGKTVLLKALLGLLEFKGKVLWKRDVKIGYVPQRVPLNKNLPISVEDFFSLRKISHHDTQELLKQVGLTGPAILKNQLGNLSSGQFQRILIAWTLANNPDLLLFDEPTAGVDFAGEETIHNLLQHIQKKRNLSIILVTHDLTTVYSEASNVLCLNGKASCYGPPEKILTPEILRKIYGGEVKFFRHSHG